MCNGKFDRSKNQAGGVAMELPDEIWVDGRSGNLIHAYALEDMAMPFKSVRYTRADRVCAWESMRHNHANISHKTGCGRYVHLHEADKSRPCWCGGKVVVK